MKQTPPFSPAISRKLLKHITTNELRYDNWMYDFLSPREFYYFRKFSCTLLAHGDLLRYLHSVQDSYRLTLDDLRILEQHLTKLGVILVLYRCGFLDLRIKPKCFYVNMFSYTLFLVRVSLFEKLSMFKSVNDSYKFFNTDSSITIVAPVCPDYAYQTISPSHYRYTFDGVGNGIGLVAGKAISTLSQFLKSVQDCPALLNKISPIILIGDFEAKSRNLKALNLTQAQFVSQIESSVKLITSSTNWSSNKFTVTCDGFENWLISENILKYQLSLFSYSDLLDKYPFISHENNLISRIPLYSRWFKGELDFKNIFFDQVVEYILMGKLVAEYFCGPTFLLTSDHRAMRNYYGLAANLNIISSSASY